MSCFQEVEHNSLLLRCGLLVVNSLQRVYSVEGGGAGKFTVEKPNTVP